MILAVKTTATKATEHNTPNNLKGVQPWRRSVLETREATARARQARGVGPHAQ